MRSVSTDHLAAARALGPRIRELQPETEAARRLPAELVDALRAAGLFRMAMPASVGGDETDLATMLRAIEEVSEADGSTGWCVMIAATSGVVLAYASDEARAAFGPDTVLGGVLAPKGTVEPADGGYRISAQWPFASGCQHCDWLVGGCVIDGIPRMALFPRDDVEIIDTWDVSGLRGTGSHDFEVRDVFVPKERIISVMTDRPIEDGLLYRFPLFGLLAVAVAAVALGIARRAVRELVDLAGAKTPTLQRRTLAERPTIQADVARAEALRRSASALLYGAVADAWEKGDLTTEHRAALRLAATNAARACAQAVDLCYDAGGGTSIYATSALQRCFRDIHALTQHMIVSPATYEQIGRVVLGVETDTSML